MANARTARQALLSAADILETEGWTKGAFMCKRGRRCALGAIAAAAGVLKVHPKEDRDPDERDISYVDFNGGNRTVWIAAVGRLASYLRRTSSARDEYGHQGTIADYNDTDSRRRSDVIKALRAAADFKPAKRAA